MKQTEDIDRDASVLASTAKNPGALYPHEVHLTSIELARMAHCSRQSLHEAIKLLAEQGVVRQRYGYLEVLETKKLKQIYEGHG